MNQLRRKKIKNFFGFKNESLEQEKNVLVAFENIQNTQASSKILKAVESLPSQQRAMLGLYFFNELSMEEIATIEKCSVGTVKSRLFRAKEKLNSILKDEVL